MHAREALIKEHKSNSAMFTISANRDSKKDYKIVLS